MRLTTVIVLACLIQVSAATFGQKITIHKHSARLTAVFKEIREQSGYDFIYDSKDVPKDQKISISLTNANLEDAVRAALRGSKLAFEIEGKIVIIKKAKSPSFFDKVINIIRQIEVKGIVMDENGFPLSGATITIKGKTKSVKSNENGFFILQGVDEKDKIVISYIGYETREVEASENLGELRLNLAKSELDLVSINAGYYSVSEKERTGSISKITSKEIGQQPVANILSAMQGRMAGVNIKQESGNPGSGFEVQIRGRNSLRTEGNAPLYIIDGVPYPSNSPSDMNLSVGIFYAGNVSPLNALSPNDIESIEVLKDADATAIYGSRGSNGVVLITTKKSTKDNSRISLQSTASISSVGKFMEMMNTEDYLEMRREAYKNDGINLIPANAYDINGTWDQQRNTNWQKEMLGKTALSHNSQVSIGGGSGQTQFLLSANYRKDGTVYIKDFGYNRTGFLLSVSHVSKDGRFEVKSSMQKNDQKNHLMILDLVNSVRLAPNAPSLYDTHGNLNWENNTFDNPLAKLNAQYFSETGDFIGNVNLGYKIIPNLKFNVSVGLSNNHYDENKMQPHTIYNPAYGLTSANSSLSSANFKRKSWIVEPQIQWSKQKNKNKWDVLIGGTIESRNQDAKSFYSANFTSNDFIWNTANAVTHMVTRDTEQLYRYLGFFGRFNYTYEDRYVINLTGRRDGSSRFGDRNRFANFGAVGLAWMFSNEQLFSNSSWLSFGKLRASYGIAGSDLIGDYQYFNTLSISTNKYNDIVGLAPMRLYNPDFSWETNKKLEFALDLEFFKGKLGASLAYYRNRSSNQLVGIPLPAITGFGTVQANLAATVQNTGLEFTLNSMNIQNKNFKWKTDFNLSIPRNKLVSFPNLKESTYANQYQIGKPITSKNVYRYLGVNKDTGLYEVEDVNRDGEITYDDRIINVNVGTSLFGGINNSLTYKDWSLDILWQFVKQYSTTPDYDNSIFLGTLFNAPKRANNYYRSGNTDALYQKPSTGMDVNAYRAFGDYQLSDGVYNDASYIRLKTLQLQYTFHTKWLKNSAISSFIQANNLLTITNYWGRDPETYGSFLPTLRTIALGFKLGF